MSKADENSKKRTRWSEDRTLLSSERTFSSWIGTGLGSVGVAIGLKAVFGSFEPLWAAKAVASTFLAASILIFWAARHQACATQARLNDHDTEIQHPKRITWLTSILTVATIGVGAILWTL
jgi:putative membrane protein